MSNKITVEVQDQVVAKKMAELLAKSGNVSGPMNVVGRKITNRVKLNFRSSSSPWGTQWKSLQMRDGQPLRDTRRLQDSITYRVSGVGADQFVDIGTNVKYARVHQYGAEIHPVHARLLRFMGPRGPIFAKKVVVPARPFLPIQGNGIVLPPEWGKDVTTALYRHFQNKAGAAL